MPDDLRPRDIGDMPAQHPLTPRSAAEARGRFFNTGNAFNIVNPPVPDHAFVDEPRRALDEATPTGLIDCDISTILRCPFPATSPLVLARYARIRAGETLTTNFETSGTIAYVIKGTGITLCAAEQIAWAAGDIFVLPGGIAASHTAETTAVLWLVTNEPQLALENLRAPSPGQCADRPRALPRRGNRSPDRPAPRRRPQRHDRRLGAGVLGGAAGSDTQHPAHPDRRDEHAAGGLRATAAPAQFGRRVADHPGRQLLLHHRRPTQKLVALGHHHHAAGFGPLPS